MRAPDPQSMAEIGSKIDDEMPIQSAWSMLMMMMIIIVMRLTMSMTETA